MKKSVKNWNRNKKCDDDTDNEHSKTNSNLFDNDIYAEDNYRSSANHHQQMNASKQKEPQHSKSLQVLVEKRKKEQGETRTSIKLNKFRFL